MSSLVVRASSLLDSLVRDFQSCVGISSHLKVGSCAFYYSHNRMEKLQTPLNMVGKITE